jgi:hypothetical protein
MKFLRLIIRLIQGLMLVGLIVVIALFSICNYAMKHAKKY